MVSLVSLVDEKYQRFRGIRQTQTCLDLLLASERKLVAARAAKGCRGWRIEVRWEGVAPMVSGDNVADVLGNCGGEF